MATLTPVTLSATGGLPDLCWTGAGWFVVYKRPDPALQLLWLTPSGAVAAAAEIAVDVEDNTFPRVWADGARLRLAYRAMRDGVLHAVIRDIDGQTLSPELLLGRCDGNDPVCLSDGWCAWQDGPAGVVYGRAFADGRVEELRPEVRPTGLSRLVGSRVVFKDEDRGAIAGMLNPVWAGDAVVGEAPAGGIGAHVGTARGVLLPGEYTTSPRVTAGPTGTYGVVWYGKNGGVSFATFTAADVVDPPIDVPAIGRPLLLAWFTDGAQDTPGNADLFVDYHGQPASNLVRLRATGAAVARYVAAEADGGLAALNAACRAARLLEPRLPVIAYCPAGFLETQGVPHDADIVGIEAYRHRGESLDQFAARIGGAIGQAGGFRLALIPQDYISNAGNDPDVAALVPTIARLAIAAKDVLAILPFSAGSRPGGWTDTPEAARQAWRCLASGIPGTPVLPSPAPVPPPIPPAPPAPVTRFPAARARRGVSMRVFLKRLGRYVGVEPSAQRPGELAAEYEQRMRAAVYADRDAGAAWEEVELTPLGDGEFGARLVAADRQLSIQPDGSLETREAGTLGAYERLRATSQPEGLNLLYRVADGMPCGVPLVIAEA